MSEHDWIADYGEEGYIITNGVEMFGVNHNYGKPERLAAILRADHNAAEKLRQATAVLKYARRTTEDAKLLEMIDAL
jgi:hypothetical protein